MTTDSVLATPHTDSASGYNRGDAYVGPVASGPNSLLGQALRDTYSASAGQGSNIDTDYNASDPQSSIVGVEQSSPGQANGPAVSSQLSPVLEDPLIGWLADDVDQAELVWKAANNRLKLATRKEPDNDGIQRGLGLDPNDPTVEHMTKYVAQLAEMKKVAVRNLERQMKNHPLGPWVASMKGVGFPAGGRLLGAVQDPYWNNRDGRPRTKSEFRSYCGFGDAQRQRRGNGQAHNWSPKARSRTWVIAEACVKQLRKPCAVPEGQSWAEHVKDCRCSPYRLIYDENRKHTVGTTHPTTCRQCGRSGNPALAGSPRSNRHLMAMAYRKIAQTFLNDLWTEAKRLHEEAAA